MFLSQLESNHEYAQLTKENNNNKQGIQQTTNNNSVSLTLSSISFRLYEPVYFKEKVLSLLHHFPDNVLVSHCKRTKTYTQHTQHNRRSSRRSRIMNTVEISMNTSPTSNTSSSTMEGISMEGISMEGISIADVARDLRVQVPNEFLCPITLEVMTCPVQTKYGLNFEKSAIEEWLRTSRSCSCPLTRQPLTRHDLVPNKSLQQQIMIWAWFQCLPVRLRMIKYSNGICRLLVCPAPKELLLRY